MVRLRRCDHIFLIKWSGLHLEAPFVNRLRGGRTMRDEDEEATSETDEESEVDDDQDDEYDDDTDNASFASDGSESADEDDTDDDELLPQSPRKSKKASSRDELPQTVVSDTRDEGGAALTSAGARAPGQLLEQRDANEAAGPSFLSLDVSTHISEQTKALNGMRAEGVLTDVHLACKGGAKLAAHRVVLAAASPQLRDMVQNLGPASAAAEQVGRLTLGVTGAPLS